MPLPDVRLVILDPGLGIVPPSAGNTQVKAGVCDKLTPNTLVGCGSVQAAKDALGAGPLLEAVVQALSVPNAGPVYALGVLPSTQGTVTGAFSLAGSGTGTVTGSKGPRQTIAVKITTGGTLGVAQFAVSINGGAYGSPVLTAATYQVPGAYFTTLGFAAGTYVLNDVYTLNLDGTVSRVGSGTATLLDTSTHSPVDAYEIRVRIVTAGALGTAAFQLSLDGGNTYGATIGVPAGGKYVIPQTGVVLTFAGTFTAADVYSGTATHATYGNSDATTALTALLADPTKWAWVHMVGTPANAAAAASLAAVVDTQMTAAEAAFRYVRALVECPQGESDSTIKTAFQSFVSTRIWVTVGDQRLISPLTGRQDRRNLAWSFTARLGAITPSQSPAAVADGRLRNVSAIFRDEAATPGLNDTRFITQRTFVGLPGYFVTDFQTMASPGSDYSNGMNCRVMDIACDGARAEYVLLVNAKVRVDTTTGYIDERDAQAIDAVVTAKLQGLLAGEISENPDGSAAVAAQISRTTNLFTTTTIPAEVSIVPVGYLKNITVNIGFKNPGLQVG